MKTTKQAGEAQMMASACKAMSGIKIEILGTWVWCSGQTREHRANLKELGFKFSTHKQAWYWYSGTFRKKTRGEHTLPEVRSMFQGSRSLIQDERS